VKGKEAFAVLATHMLSLQVHGPQSEHHLKLCTLVNLTEGHYMHYGNVTMKLLCTINLC
jgi:hypothetical protein